MLQPYPQFTPELVDADALSEVQWLQSVITGLRTLRSELNISPSKWVPEILCRQPAQLAAARLATHAELIQPLVKVTGIRWVATEATLPATAMLLLGDLQLHVPLAGLIDVEAESARIAREIAALEQDLQRATVKLANEKFMQSAPATIVAQEQARFAACTEAIAKLQVQRANLTTLT